MDLESVALDITNHLTISAISNCKPEWEALACLYKAPQKPTRAEMEKCFKRLMSRLDDEILRIHRGEK